MRLDSVGWLDLDLSAPGTINMEGPGGMMFNVVRPVVGNTIFLDPANGADTNNGLSPKAAFATLPAAYAALTDNNNDILVYIATLNGQIKLTAGFTWAKNCTHFFGYGSRGPNSRARIYQDSAATGVTSLFTVSGSGCVFSNLQILQGVADATSRVAVTVTGQRNQFKGCHFAGIGNTAQDVAGAASLVLDGGNADNGENEFDDCYIGLDTVASGANGTEIIMQNGAARNVFYNCFIYRFINNAGHALLTIPAKGIDRYNFFKFCVFSTDSLNQTVVPTQLISIGAATQGKLMLMYCDGSSDGTSASSTVWTTSSAQILHNNAALPGAAGTAGIARIL